MADVQVEHGYTRIADELFEALIRSLMPGRHKDCVFAIIRLTYGYGQKERVMGAGLVAALVHIDERRTRRYLADLEKWGVITRKPGEPGRASMIGLVKDFDKWSVGTPPRGGGSPGPVQPGRATEDPGPQQPDSPGPLEPYSPGPQQPDSIENLKENSTENRAPTEPTPESQARNLWPRLRAAASSHGVTWAKKPGSAQVKLLATRIRDDGLGDEDLVAIIHGYIALRGKATDNGFNPLAHLYPKTLYRPSNWPDYLAAGRAPPPRKALHQQQSQPRSTYIEPQREEGVKYVGDMSEEEHADMIEQGRKIYEH